MPFNIPTPDQTAARIAAEIEAQLPGADARSARSVLAALARAYALGIYPVHLFGGWLADQVIADTAEAEWLERHASLWGVARRPPASARGSLRLTGLPGTILPAASLLSLSGRLYQTLADAAIAPGGTALVTIAAVEPGAAGNQPVGTRLTIAVPVAGLDPAGIVVDDGAGGGLTGGTDIEAEAVWRDRLIDRIQQPPHGGAASDYITWARQVPGVAQVAVYPEQFGPGTVGVCFSVTGDSPIPSPDQVAAVLAHLEEVRPVTARLSVYAVTPVPIDVSIEIIPDSAAVREAVAAAIDEWFAAEARIGERVYRSRLSEAVSADQGEYAHRLLLPTGDVAIAAGHLAVPGTVILTGAST